MKNYMKKKIDRAWFSRLLQHPASKCSRSILTTLEPARAAGVIFLPAGDPSDTERTLSHRQHTGGNLLEKVWAKFHSTVKFPCDQSASTPQFQTTNYKTRQQIHKVFRMSSSLSHRKVVKCTCKFYLHLFQTSQLILLSVLFKWLIFFQRIFWC